MDLLSFANDALYDGLPYALVCLSFVLTAKYLRFPDLTCSGSFVLGGAVAAVAIVKGGWHPLAATALALAFGGAAGMLTGIFYTTLRLDRLLAGILATFVLYSVNLLLLTPTLAYGSRATLLSFFEANDGQITSGNISWHPWVIGCILGLVVGAKLLLDRFLDSEVGLALRALEDQDAGELVLERQGLSPDRYKMLALVLGNAIVGLAGALVSFKEGAANADRGFDLLITALVAFLVGTQLFHVLSTVAAKVLPRSTRWFRPRPSTSAICGALAYFGLITLSQRLQVPSAYTKILLVGLVALSVAQPASLVRLLARRRDGLRSDGNAGVLLSVRNLSFRYPSADNDSLKAVSFEIPEKSVVKLSGANGTGKTTALRVIAGFLDAVHGGRVTYEGRDVTERREDRLKQIAYVDQYAQRGVVGTLSTEENLALATVGATPSLWRRALNGRTRKHVLDVVQRAHLSTDVLPQLGGHLSGGQQQVVNLLGLLARHQLPRLILLDEPTNNLDAANAARCREIIEQLHQDGAAILLVSHTPLAGLNIDTEIELSNGVRGITGPVSPVATGGKP